MHIYDSPYLYRIGEYFLFFRFIVLAYRLYIRGKLSGKFNLDAMRSAEIFVHDIDIVLMILFTLEFVIQK